MPLKEIERCQFCTRDAEWDKSDGGEWNGKPFCHECSISYKYVMKPQVDGHLCWRHGLTQEVGGCSQCKVEGY